MNKKRLVDEVCRLIHEEIQGLDQDSASRKSDLERQLQVMRFLPTRDYPADEPIIPTSLVKVRTGSTESVYFMIPSGGGWVTRVDGVPVQIVTPNSPIGEALLGRKAGEKIEVQTRSGTRSLEILSTS